MSQVITANNKAAFMVKVKDALKLKYKQGEEVNLEEFSYQFGVQPKNIKLAIRELEEAGFKLLLPESDKP
ncbi:MAG: hypothetical protein E6L02_05290 [Thaumarchaeota archaeon]|nr:MAG: hypothetical protein E6L02_05290 [Nitrososphaerota archaeon]